MKNLLFPLKEHIIEWLILVMALIILTATIFSAVVILNPELFPQYPLVRDTVSSLSAAAMVFATLLLALGTFVIIRKDRQREDRSRKERYLNEILEWLREIEDAIFTSTAVDIYKEIQEDKDLVTSLGVTKEDLERQRQLDIRITNLANLRREIRNGQYFKRVSLKLNSDFSELINNILCLLEQRRKLIMEQAQYPLDTIEDITKEFKAGVHKLLIDLIEDNTKPLDGLNLSEKNINHILIGRNAGDIKESTNKAIEKAIGLKYAI